MELIEVNSLSEILHLVSKVLIMELELEVVVDHKIGVSDLRKIVFIHGAAMAMYFNFCDSVATKDVNHFRLGNFCGGLMVFYFQ